MSDLHEYEIDVTVRVKAASPEAAQEFVERCLDDQSSINPALEVVGIAMSAADEIEPTPMHDSQEASICRHCQHGIVQENGTWVAPDAGTDMDGDGIWRETCPDNHENRIAPHEPEEN